jgi:hypothetical protein
MTNADGSEQKIKIDGLNDFNLKCVRTHPNMTKNRLPYIFGMDLCEKVFCKRITLIPNKDNRNL